MIADKDVWIWLLGIEIGITAVFKHVSKTEKQIIPTYPYPK